MTCDLDCTDANPLVTNTVPSSRDHDDGSAIGGARQLDQDELRGVVDTISAKYPTHPRSEIERVVADAYQHLAVNARVTSHLIPLTLNRSLRLMRSVGRDTGGPLGPTPRGTLLSPAGR